MKRIISNSHALKATTFALIFALFSFAQAQEKPIDIVFVDHLTAGLIEQDVFVEKEAGSNQVYRVMPAEKLKYLDAPLYKTAQKQSHNPFNPETIGPFEKGEPVGMTLREWLKAKGTATYQCEGGWGTLNASFENLVPNGVYTFWHFFMAKANTEPFVGTLDVPVGEPDGTQSVFVADENGNATVNLKIDRCLQLSDIQLMGGLAIAYHSDGKTYKADPGPFGKHTHVQVFAMLPDVEKPTKESYGDK